MRLRDKISNGKRPVVVYEILPPRIIDGTIESYAERISTLLSMTHIDAINIPEVHSEETRGDRPVEEQQRAIPRDFGRIIQDSVGVEVIVNRVTVLEKHNDQREWFRETSEDFGIDNIVLVGGESSQIDYPGPGVSEAATMIEEIIIFFQIILIDLVLAGDNAIIIGMVASQFDSKLRKKIIFWGIAFAIVLRIIFTLITAYLLQINGLKTIGGLLLLYIAYKLYKDVIKNNNSNIDVIDFEYLLDLHV